MSEEIKARLTWKNFLSIVVGVCVVLLALIPLKVDPSHLTWMRWQAAVLLLALCGVAAIIWQAFLQSKEDHESHERERKRDLRLDSMHELLTRLAQPFPNTSTPQTVVATEQQPITIAKDPSIKVFLEEMTLGLRMLWLENTFLFISCHIVSIGKATSILQIRPTIVMKDGSRFVSRLLESLSEWIYEPTWDKRIDMESLSLWKKLKEGALQDEIQKEGWLGLEIPLSAQKAGDFSAVGAVELCIVDAAEREHIISLQSPWPVNAEHLIIAKHVRQR